jgi:hypothetical protein
VFLIMTTCVYITANRSRRGWQRKEQIGCSTPAQPELNPEERLNADLKQAMGKRVPVRTKAKLRDAANEHMAMLEKSPERVMSYFQDPRVKYAAA